MLAIYRRHVSACPHRSRAYRRCKCPLWVQGTLAGEVVRQSLDLSSWEAAQTLVREWETKGAISRAAVSVAEAVEKFLTDCEARLLSGETVLLYRRFLERHFVPWCVSNGFVRLDSLDVEAIRDYRSTWTWAGTTASRRVERLRTFFSFCVEAGWTQKNPAKSLRSPMTQQLPTEPFTDEEMTRILGACDRLVTRGTYGLDNRKRVSAFVLVLRYTGLRISDAARLNTSKVRDGRVFLYTQKTGVPVWVPIPDFVSSALADVPRRGEFYFQTGEACAKTVRGSWDRTLRVIFSLAGVDGGHAHRFRDTFAVSLLLEGVDLQDVSILLGHSSMKVTEKHYAPWVKARQARLEEAVMKTWKPFQTAPWTHCEMLRSLTPETGASRQIGAVIQ